MSSRRTRAFRWDIPRLGNPQEQGRITLCFFGRTFPLLQRNFPPFSEKFFSFFGENFPFSGGIFPLFRRNFCCGEWNEATKNIPIPPMSQHPTLHPCLWHHPIPSGLEDTEIRLLKKKNQNAGGFKKQLQKRERTDFFFHLIQCSQSKLHSTGSLL